jgi:hypothetical protein
MNWIRGEKSQCRNTGSMNKQGNMIPPKVNNATKKGSNDSGEHEIPHKKFKE